MENKQLFRHHLRSHQARLPHHRTAAAQPWAFPTENLGLFLLAVDFAYIALFELEPDDRVRDFRSSAAEASASAASKDEHE